MKVHEIVSGLDRSESNTHEPNWELITREMEIYDSFWTDDKRLVYHWAQQWYCTDTYVGTRVYVLDGLLVAISSQEARKSNEKFHWLNYKVAYDYVHSLYQKNEPCNYNKIGLDDDWCKSEFFVLEYGSQIIYDKGWYGGVLVDIIKTNHSITDWKKFHDVDIRFGDNVITVDCRELRFKYNQRLKYND